MSKSLEAITKMVSELPEPLQKEVEEHLREYIVELLSEARWEHLFEATADRLAEWAERVKEEARRGEAEDFDFLRL